MSDDSMIQYDRDLQERRQREGSSFDDTLEALDLEIADRWDAGQERGTYHEGRLRGLEWARFLFRSWYYRLPDDVDEPRSPTEDRNTQTTVAEILDFFDGRPMVGHRGEVTKILLERGWLDVERDPKGIRRFRAVPPLLRNHRDENETVF